MPHADVNGQRIHYQDTGGDGPPVVLGHGFLMDRSMFDPQIEALAPSYRVVTWDARGFGETEYDGEPFTYWDLADDGAVDAEVIEHAVVGGMSQGGFSALRAALRAPDRVRALILLDTQAGPEDPEVIPAYQAMADDWVANGPSDELAAVIANLIITDAEHEPAWIAKWQARPPAAMAQPSATLFGREDLSDQVGAITAPALVVHGDNDQSIDLAKAEALVSLLPNAEPLVVVPGGHAANLTGPGPVNAAILDFLGRLPA